MFVQHSRRLASAVVSRGAALQQWQQASCSVRPFIAARPELRQRSKRSVHVLASWGAPVEFSPAKVVSNTKVTPELHQMVVDVGADKAAGYTKGGQFVQLKVGEGKPGFFAIASPPDPNNQGLLEFLIKAKGEAAEALAALPAGAEVQSSPVMGKGFPLERIPAEACPTVLLFATGEPQPQIRQGLTAHECSVHSRILCSPHGLCATQQHHIPSEAAAMQPCAQTCMLAVLSNCRLWYQPHQGRD
jgi:hypothetical protein